MRPRGPAGRSRSGSGPFGSSSGAKRRPGSSKGRHGNGRESGNAPPTGRRPSESGRETRDAAWIDEDRCVRLRAATWSGTTVAQPRRLAPPRRRPHRGSPAAGSPPRRSSTPPPPADNALLLTPRRPERLACTHSLPIRPRSGVEERPRSERRQPPAGRTPPPAGPGTAVRPQSRGREGRRPRDGRRTPALATAHPAGLNGGPARRVRLSQIPGQGRRKRRANAAAERPGHRISAFHLAGAGKERGFAAGRHFLATTTAVPDEGAALSGRPA